MNVTRKLILGAMSTLAALFLIVSCASIGTPTGGPRDEDPPRFVTATPLQGAVEVSPTKAVLTFDELVALKDAFSKVVVSPPGEQTPRVSSMGRRVTVEFRDSLLPNTTYTVDFGDAIVDNNEGNRLESFIYTFSTGPVLDTLMVSGMVLGAEDLEPAKGIYVGLHSNPADSAFRKLRFERIAKTDENGRFVIGGLAPGNYRIYALEDKDGDLKWSSPEETLAFYDYIISPEAEQTEASDTIFDLFTGKVDSVLTRVRTRFLPNNILLRSYNTGFKQQYITKYERVDSARMNFIFNAPADSMPLFEVTVPGTDGGYELLENVASTERSATNDTITFWLKDKAYIQSDTLRVALRYLRPDSVYALQPVNDTLRMVAPKIKPAKSKTTTDTVPAPVPVFEFKALNTKPEIYSRLIFEAPVPIDSFNADGVRLEIKEDTLWLPLEGFGIDRISFDTLNPRRFSIEYPWEYEGKYKVTIDSLASKTIYGVYNDDLNYEFNIRPENEYCSLQFNVSGMANDSVPLYVELLDGSGKGLRALPVTGGSVLFEHLLAGKYNARIVIDRNGNGQWDPGNFDLGLQPDYTYYYPETIDLKQSWSQELDWDVFAKPVDLMKPTNKKSTTAPRR